MTLRETAFYTGAVDLLVTDVPRLPRALACPSASASDGRRFRDLVERVGDSDLAAAAGYPIAVNDDGYRLLLSPREREVFELFRSGFSNSQIEACSILRSRP